MHKKCKDGDRHQNGSCLEAGPPPVMNASGLKSRVSAGELWMIVVPGIGFLIEINEGLNTLMNLIEFLPLIGGFVYDEEYLDGGVYYHHTGSSCSAPKGSNSWIRAIKRACGLDHDENLDCCVSDCNADAECGAHLTESRISEFLSLIGMGGTPVVPMCYGCHGTGPVEIDGTPCIYDTETPIDFLWGKPTLSNVRCSNENCGSYTVGPDSEDNYWCQDCGHYVDSDGDCVTDGCTSDGCCDDDDDDDDDDDGWW